MTQPPEALTDHQLLRYSRHILLPQVDIAGQQRIVNSRVLVLGAGGLGSPVLLYLAAAGVGELLVADGDRVDETNLQRQIVHRTGAVGEKKTSSARSSLAELNPDVQVTEIDSHLDEASMLAWARGCDAVVIGTDSFTSRYAANRACMALGIPLISGAAIGLTGQLSVFDFRRGDSPCYSCLFPDGRDEDISCATTGVLGPVVGVVGSVLAAETLKVLAQFGEPLVGTLLTLDAADMSWQQFRFRRQPDCPVCQRRYASD